jgi:hypothetical protein
MYRNLDNAIRASSLVFLASFPRAPSCISGGGGADNFAQLPNCEQAFAFAFFLAQKHQN